jgi:hypothetical protein
MFFSLLATSLCNRVLVGRDACLTFELQYAHLWLHSYELSYYNGCNPDPAT